MIRSLYASINANKRSFPEQSIHELVEQQAAQSPRSVAVVCDDQSQTYDQLSSRSDQIANYLKTRGVGAGDLVGLCCDRNVETPALLLGILKSGAGYVPLDPDYPAERLAYMVSDSKVQHILANRNQESLIASFECDSTIVENAEDAIANAPQAVLNAVEDGATHVAYVIYTSGSTGRPKGVRVPHRAAVNLLWSMQEWPGFTAKDRILATTTLSFDISFPEMFLPLVVGGSVAVVDRRTAKDPALLVEAIEKQQVTMMQATPAMWRLILESEFRGNASMKFVTAGEPLPRDLIQPMLDRCGELWNLYGPTETTVYSTGARIESDQGRILIGVPVANTDVFVVDENNELCPVGTPGELLIGGEGVTLGYLNRSELNAEKFVLFEGQTVYRTGDLAQITEDGQVDHLGRIDNQIKFHGHRIELGEIDAAMAMQPGVRQAATVLREDRPGDQRLVGYLLADSSGQIDRSQIREALAGVLPDYMVPNTFAIVEKFPYTPSGKLDRKQFPQPSQERPDLGVDYFAPQTAEQKALAEIWSEVLQIEDVGIRDNFFDLGGNSIRVAKVVAQAKSEMGIDLSAAKFFDRPTIESLLEGGGGAAIQGCTDMANSISDRENEYAIVGMAARMPGAENVNVFWQNLVEGKESIRFFSPEELDSTLDPRDTQSPNYCAARGVIEEADQFDARFFQIMPRAAELIDPQQRIMLEITWSALEDAGIVVNDNNRIGVWAGTYETTYYQKNVLSHPDIVRETGEFQIGTYNEKDYIATRTAHALNLRGPAINVNTACSTSLVTLIEACKSLALGHCDAAVAGAVSVHFPQNCGHLHQEGSIFSPDGHCRPFDANAAGTLFCDGAGVVVVKRLTDALANGDRIYAVVKGCGMNNDGGGKASFSAPSITGQSGAIAMAHRDAGVTADSIGYVEAHGTATPVGDPIEVAALQAVFDQSTGKKQFCAIGSVKSNIGHTVAAAGVAGLIKTAMSLHHEQIPATIHYQKPNPQIDFEDSPFFVCDRLTPWPKSETPRRAGVSAFGVGGTNAHVVLEEAPQVSAKPVPPVDSSIPIELFPISAKTEDALSASVAGLANWISDGGSHRNLSDVASTLQHHRSEFQYRGFCVGATTSEFCDALNSQKAPGFYRRKSTTVARDVVFMFPGQGSQYVRMGQDLYQHNALFRGNIDRCSEVLKPLLGRDLRDVLFPPKDHEEASQEILKATQFTQPALFALGYSLAQLWISWGIKPNALMGHSIGEFAAACTAGVFSLEDGLAMIAQRGAAMQALPGGSMMSVRLPGTEVEPLLWGDLAIGSYNGPKLCVVSGPEDQVEALQQKLEAKDVVCRHLHTSHAFHSPMMNSIVEPYAEFIAQYSLSAPQVPILSTVTGQWMTDQQATDPRYWAEHLRQPVRFSEAVSEMWKGDPTRILIELGPRKTLATLAKQHANEPKAQLAFPTLSDNAKDHTEWRTQLNAVGQLWLAGVAIDWKKLFKQHGTFTSIPTYPFQRKRFFIEPNSTTRRSDSLQTNVRLIKSPPKSAESTNLATEMDSPIHQSIQPARRTKMSRKQNIVTAINEVFENTSGFDLTEFDQDTTFFEMGLDSLVLTQTATALKKAFEVEVTFRQLLEETPHVDALAEFLDATLPTEAFADLPAEAGGEVASPSSMDSGANSIETPNTPETPMELPVSQQAIQTDPASVYQPEVPNATQMPIPFQTTVGSGTHAIIQNQLQLMAAQLQLLGGTASINLPQAATMQNVASSAEACSPQVDVESVSKPDEGVCVPQSAPAMPVAAVSARSATGSSDDTPKAKRFSTVKVTDGTLDADQQVALDEIIRLNNLMLPKSKAYAQEHRHYMADPRTVSGFRPNMKEMTHPIVVERSKGVNLWDIDGNEYIDFTCGFGSNLLGHTHEITVKAISEQVQMDYAIGPQSPLAGEVAKLFCEITGNERMAFSNTGSEAVLGCTRLARNATGRDLIVMFNGDYHGILDEVIARGSKRLKSFPAATGIPKDHVGNTLILEYGTDESLAIIRDRMDEIAAILVEPVQSRMPELQPREFLLELSRMTEGQPTALIFDEVISGLRIGLGGAQEFFGIRADLAAYGKIVGGGMPIGVVAGKAEYMDGLDGGYWQFGDDSRPEAGMTYFAGTFVRHPLTLAASKAILEHLKAGGKPMYDRLNSVSDYLASELNQVFEAMDAPLFLANFGSLFKIQFHQELVYSEVFFAGLRRRGMHIWDHRPCLLTLAHEKEHIDRLVAAMRETIAECQRHGFMPGEGYKSVSTSFDPSNPPVGNAKPGKDRQGQPGWFIPDVGNPGQFIQLGVPS